MAPKPPLLPYSYTCDEYVGWATKARQFARPVRKQKKRVDHNAARLRDQRFLAGLCTKAAQLGVLPFEITLSKQWRLTRPSPPRPIISTQRSAQLRARTPSPPPSLKTQQKIKRWETIHTNRLCAIELIERNPQLSGPESLLFQELKTTIGPQFGSELYQAIRNDQFMKDCLCDLPIIHQSEQEAREKGNAHLNFYYNNPKNPDRKNLGVFQNSQNPRWYCMCGGDKRHAYKNLLNKNNKRPAEDIELELRSQNEGVASGSIVERVLPSASSMCGTVYGLACKMAGSVFNFLGSFRKGWQDVAGRHDVVERIGIVDGHQSVKRLKRQASVPVQPTSSPEPTLDAVLPFPMTWAKDPTSYIGQKALDAIRHELLRRASIPTDHILSSTSIERIKEEIGDEDLELSIAIYKMTVDEVGDLSPFDTEAEMAQKHATGIKLYYMSLRRTIDFIDEIYYKQKEFNEAVAASPQPPQQLNIGNAKFHMEAKETAEFLQWIIRRQDLHGLEPYRQELSKIAVDANAIHKQEVLPSFIVCAGKDTPLLPGSFPGLIYDELPVGGVTVEPRHALRFPTTDTQNTRISNPPRLIKKPKGILKQSKNWGEGPASPRYVATPDKRTKLAFESPVSKFIPPIHNPVKVIGAPEPKPKTKPPMDPAIFHLLTKPAKDAPETPTKDSKTPDSTPEKSTPSRWTDEMVEKDDKKMGLRYHDGKYGSFLDGMKTDLEDKLAKPFTPEFKRTREREDVTPMPSRLPLKQWPSKKPNTSIATVEERRRLIDQLFKDSKSDDSESESGESPVKPQKQTSDPFDDELEISIKKLDDLEVSRQVQEEWQDGLRREAERKKQEEIRRREEEERRKIEEERQRKEAERRRVLEARRAKEEREAAEYAALTGLRKPMRPMVLSALSRDWTEKVNNAEMANPSIELAKTLDGSPVTSRDFGKLIPETAWLNDTLIIGSILHLAEYVNRGIAAKDQKKCIAFTSYFYPRLEKNGPKSCARMMRLAGLRKANFFDVDTILIPICADLHWTLAVVRPKMRAVSHMDSMRGGAGNPAVTRLVMDWVKDTLEGDFDENAWKTVDYQAPRQNNGWDCGVFTIANAMCMALGLDPKQSYVQNDLKRMRKQLGAMLLNGGFTNDFSLDGL